MCEYSPTTDYSSHSRQLQIVLSGTNPPYHRKHPAVLVIIEATLLWLTASLIGVSRFKFSVKILGDDDPPDFISQTLHQPRLVNAAVSTTSGIRLRWPIPVGESIDTPLEADSVFSSAWFFLGRFFGMRCGSQPFFPGCRWRWWWRSSICGGGGGGGGGGGRGGGSRGGSRSCRCRGGLWPPPCIEHNAYLLEVEAHMAVPAFAAATGNVVAGTTAATATAKAKTPIPTHSVHVAHSLNT